MHELNLKYTRIRPVKRPQRGTELSTGIDFFIPEGTFKYLEVLNRKNSDLIISDDKKFFRIVPHGNVLIPSGIKVRLPEGYDLKIENKSGIAVKKRLVRGACLIDNDFQGELGFNLINTTGNYVSVEFGQKIVQGELRKINYCNLQEIDTEEELYRDHSSDRGEGGFGSTGV